MTLEPRPLDAVAASELRARARSGARRVSPALMIAGGAVIALLMVAAFVVLDYGLGADPHQLVKLLFGGAAVAVIMTIPTLGMFLFPIITPLLSLLPKFPLPGLNALNLFLLAIYVPFALARVLNRRPFLRAGALTLPLALFFGLGILSIVRASALPTGYVYRPADASLQLFRAAMSFAGYFICLAMIEGAAARRRLTWAIALALIIEGLFTAAQGRDMRDRAIGTIGQSNELGAYLAMFSAFCLALAFGVRAWWQRGLLVGGYALGVFGVILSVSRGGLLAVAIGSIYVAARSSRLLLVLVTIALATSPMWTPDFVKDRIAMTNDEGNDTELGLDPGVEVRVNTWQTLLHIVQDHAIEGIGFQSLGYVLPQVGADLGLHVKDSSHNTYLRMLAELGMFGLALTLFIFWSCFAVAEKARKLAGDRFERQLALGTSAATLGLAMSCWFGDRFFINMVTGNLWVACALCDDLVIERRRKPK